MAQRNVLLSFLLFFILLYTPSNPMATPIEDWQFFVDAGPGAFTIRPFHILQHARVDIEIEWILETTELEVSLYNPNSNEPVRYTVQRPPVRWSFDTAEIHPWKGIWRIVIRNVNSTRPSRGRITTFIDYTFKPPPELTGEPDTNQPEIYPPLQKKPESAPPERKSFNFGLKTMDLKLLEDGSAAIEVHGVFPEKPPVDVLVESADDLFSFQKNSSWKQDGQQGFVARVSPVPAVLGNHCYRARLPLASPPDDWQTSLIQCFNIRCRPETLIEPSQPHPLPPPDVDSSARPEACSAQPVDNKTARG